MRPVPCIAIVDGGPPGINVADACRKRGMAVVHVQSREAVSELMTKKFKREDYLDNIVFDGDHLKCADKLARYRPLCVVAGLDEGVALADYLSAALGLPTNGTALSVARRDKFEMAKCVERAGIRTIPTFVAADWPSAEGFVQRLERFPIVVKPVAGGGTEDVYFCSDHDQAKAAFHRIIGAMNNCGDINTAAVVQPFIRGTEYALDFVSCAGHHGIAGIWKETKMAGANSVLYDRSILVERTGETQDQLFNYGCSVLDALGIRFGPVHMEVLYTDEGPVLIELSPRVIGQNTVYLAEAVLGTSQATLTADAFLSPERFFAQITKPYVMSRHAWRVHLRSPRSGTLLDLPRMDAVRALPSFHLANIYVQPVAEIGETTDLMSIPGYIDLVHERPEVVDEDYRRIRAWEAEDFYRFAS